MKIAIISDVHGNYEALKQVLLMIEDMGIKEIFCLGDVVGYYSQVNECCNEIRERQIPCLMGNHDWYMVGGGYCLRSQSVNDTLAYQRRIITQENLDWLKTFQFQFVMDDIRMVHGGWADPIDEYLEPSEAYFSKVEGKIFISGHTHIQQVRFYSGKTYCNPGSVGQPRDNDPRAAFAVLSNGKFELHRTTYNMEKVFELMNKAGFNDYYYGSLKTGAKNLRRLE